MKKIKVKNIHSFNRKKNGIKQNDYSNKLFLTQKYLKTIFSNKMYLNIINIDNNQ